MRKTNLEVYGGSRFYTKLEEYEDYLYTLNKEELISECVKLGIDAEDTGEFRQDTSIYSEEEQWIKYIRMSVALVRDMNAVNMSNYEDRFMNIMNKKEAREEAKKKCQEYLDKHTKYLLEKIL
jgi:hypothetical protein